jgi:hypothetical protein
MVVSMASLQVALMAELLDFLLVVVKVNCKDLMWAELKGNEMVEKLETESVEY